MHRCMSSICAGACGDGRSAGLSGAQVTGVCEPHVGAGIQALALPPRRHL